MRHLVKAAQTLIADLEQRDAQGDATAHARAVLDFYVDHAHKGDYLVGPSGELKRKPKPRAPRKPWQWTRDTARDLIVRAVRENGPMTSSELLEYLARNGCERSRQGVSAALLKMRRAMVLNRSDDRPHRYWLR